jgi:hypothetical protein
VKKSNKKRARQKRSKASELKLVLEYYQFAFQEMHRELSKTTATAATVHRIREGYWALVPFGEFASAEGQEIVKLYNKSVVEELEAILGRHSIGYWLHIYRRLAPRAIGPLGSPATIGLVRRTLESAIQKYALRSCGGTAWSHEIPFERILRGALVPDNEINHRIRAALKAKPQLVLTEFWTEELKEVYSAERLAYEIWSCGSVLRTLGKGGSLRVTAGEFPYFTAVCSDELNALLNHYDDRSADYETSATGTVFQAGDSDGQYPAALYNVMKIGSETLGPVFEAYGTHITERFVPNFIWTLLPLRRFYEAHLPFAEAFQAANGVELVDVLAVTGALLTHVLVTWREKEGYIIQTFQRAYDGPWPREQFIEIIRLFLGHTLETLGSARKPEDVEIESVISALECSEQRRSAIDPLLGAPLSIFLPFGDGRVIVDYAWIHNILYDLFFGIKISDQNFKGLALEKLVHQERSVLPTVACRAKDGSSRQFDAAFESGDLLIVIECRVKARSFAIERGDRHALQLRRDFIEKALSDIDEKADWIQQHPVGTNFDIRNFRRILPVAVTPFEEFIPSLADRYWIRRDLPRVLTPDELRKALRDDLSKSENFNERTLTSASSL